MLAGESIIKIKIRLYLNHLCKYRFLTWLIGLGGEPLNQSNLFSNRTSTNSKLTIPKNSFSCKVVKWYLNIVCCPMGVLLGALHPRSFPTV